MTILAKFVSAVSRHSLRTEGHVFAITPERIAIGEGLRASVAMAPLLLAAVFFKRPEIALGAVAAFWACLCDPQGAVNVRLKTMAILAAVGTIAMPVATLAANLGHVVSFAALFFLVFLCGLMRSYKPAFGPMPAQTGLIASLAVVIGIASPRALTGALELGGYFLLGSVWAMLFCIFLWRIPFRQSGRLALTAIFGRLEDMAAFLEILNTRPVTERNGWSEFDTIHRRGVRMSIERGRALAALDADNANGPQFSSYIDATGRVFSALIAIGHVRRNSPVALDDEAARLLKGLRQLLQDISAHMLQDESISGTLATQAVALLQETADRKHATARSVAFAASAIVHLANGEQIIATQDAQPAAASPARYQIDALVWRHALRVAVAAVLAFIIGTWFNFPLAYWGALAAIIVTQPISANTWLRILERACGSLIGGILAAVFLTTTHGLVGMALAILPLAAAAIALRLVNYGLFVVFLCPMFMLISDFIHPAEGLIAARFVNEVAGAVVGVAASFLFWPERDSDVLTASISAAIAANMKFASSALRLDGDSTAVLDRLQREAGITSSRLETARERMLLEGRWRSTRLSQLREVIVALRSICGAAAVMAVLRQGEPDMINRRRADDYDALSGALIKTLTSRQSIQPTPSSEVVADDLEQEIRHLAAVLHVYVCSQTQATSAGKLH